MKSSAPSAPQQPNPEFPQQNLHVFLTRINAQTNTHRWYTVIIQEDLFGRLSLITAWGSLKSAYYQQQIKHPDTLEQARYIAQKIIKSKLKKGYKTSPK